jgi:hypothetical protein
MNAKFRYAVRVALVLVVATPAQATMVGITSLSGNDTIDWAQLGETLTFFESPKIVSSTGGINTVVSSPGGLVERLNQDGLFDRLGHWGGNFAPGAAILYNLDHGSGFTLIFESPVSAVGAQIQTATFGPFTARVTSGLFSFTEDGISTGDSDGSAIFIGLSSTTPFSTVSFDMTTAPFSRVDQIAIGPVQMLDPVLLSAVPEPSTWAMMLLGFAGIGFMTYRSKNKAALQAA